MNNLCRARCHNIMRHGIKGMLAKQRRLTQAKASCHYENSAQRGLIGEITIGVSIPYPGAMSGLSYTWIATAYFADAQSWHHSTMDWFPAHWPCVYPMIKQALVVLIEIKDGVLKPNVGCIELMEAFFHWYQYAVIGEQ